MLKRHKSICTIVLFAALTLLLTYPVFGQLDRAVAGFDGRDSFQHVWYQWWLKETLLEFGLGSRQVTYLYYPLQTNHPVLTLHPYVPLVSLPLTLVFGPLVSYNLAFLLSFILSGLAGYLLCRYVSGHDGAALIGGLIFAFYPNRFGHAAAGHLLLITNYFLPLYALSLLMVLQRPSNKRVVWHGLITAMLALAQPIHIGYGMIPLLLVLAGGHLIARLRTQPDSIWPNISHLIAANVLAFMIVLPFAWPILSRSQPEELAYLTPDNLTEHSTDLLAFIMPSPYNPILAPLNLIPAFSPTIVAGFRDLEEQLAYPGLVAVGLLGLAVWRRWRSAKSWLVLSLGCALLSLGPSLKIGGEVYPVTLPYIWLARLPFFAFSRTPGRFNETVMLGIAVMSSLGAACLFDRLNRGKTGGSISQIGLNSVGPISQLFLGSVLLGVVMAAIILVEYLMILPFPTEVRSISNYYHTLARENFAGGVLELPVTGSRRASNYAMYYQTVHGHALVGGYIERDPPGTVELKEFANQLVSPIPSQTVFIAPSNAQRQRLLVDMMVERIIAHPTLMTDQAAQATAGFLPLLFGSPIFEDGETVVYSVEATADAHLPNWQILPDQPNWEVVRDGSALRLKDEGYLFIFAAKEGPVKLKFRIDSPAETSTLVVRLNDRPIKRFVIDAAATYQVRALPLKKGFNYIQLSTDPRQELEFLNISVEF